MITVTVTVLCFLFSPCSNKGREHVRTSNLEVTVLISAFSYPKEMLIGPIAKKTTLAGCCLCMAIFPSVAELSKVVFLKL
jgi:hypothetical protein